MLGHVYLELLDNMHDLGILMDSKLKFHMHTDSVVNKSYRVLGLIKKSFECKDPDIVLKLYKSLVRPIVEYANVIWGLQYSRKWNVSSVKPPELFHHFMAQLAMIE